VANKEETYRRLGEADQASLVENDGLCLQAELRALSLAPPEATAAVEFISFEEHQKLLHELREHQIELEMQNEELRRAQTVLDALRSRYFDLYQLAPVGYVTLSESGLILEANFRFSALIGVPRARLVNQPLSGFVFADDQDIYYLYRRKLLGTNKQDAVELRMKGMGGAPFWARLEASSDTAADGINLGYRLTATDVSEQHLLHTQLAQENRMASMGLLAAGVAHEINNPLTALAYSTDILARDLPALARAVTRVCRALEGQLAGEGLADIVGESCELLRESALANLGDRAVQAAAITHRIAKNVSKFSSFSRSSPSELSPTDLNASAQEAISLVLNEIKYCAKLNVDLGQVPPVMGCATELSQVFVNLLLNAAQAIKEGDREANRISVRTWSEEGQVFGEVSDTGGGIAAADLDSVFEPFFTTKGPERGTGLGLALCRKTLSDLGGAIDLKSTVAQGTRVVFHLAACPVASNPPESVAVPATFGASDVGGRILVVDDEEFVRDVVCAILEDDHEVVSVDSGRGARALIEHDRRFDLILCDLMMPDISGIELHAWLTENHSDLALRLAFITGGVFTRGTEAYLKGLSNRIIQKPFNRATLTQVARELIAANARTP
jgi:PAS domain S-box-containing protein